MTTKVQIIRSTITDADELSSNHWRGISTAMQLYADQEVKADRESRWISVEERLPEDGVANRSDSDYVLTWDGINVEMAHRSFNRDGDGYYDWIDKNSDFVPCITHWQPLPDPPKLK